MVPPMLRAGISIVSEVLRSLIMGVHQRFVRLSITVKIPGLVQTAQMYPWVHGPKSGIISSKNLSYVVKSHMKIDSERHGAMGAI